VRYHCLSICWFSPKLPRPTYIIITLGVFNASARVLPDDLGRMITISSSRLERPASCIRGCRCWYSVRMLSFCATVCRPLTAQIDDFTPRCRPASIFLIFAVRRYALHGLSHRNSVCLSACLSVRHTRGLHWTVSTWFDLRS